jgi:TonB family protein
LQNKPLQHAFEFRPTWEVGASIGVHILLVGAVWVGQLWKSDDRLFDPNEVMAVQAVALPKANRRMPDRPTRTLDRPKGDAPQAKAPPPPPTASDMALRKKEAPKTKGQTNKTDAREELLNKMRREALLKDASAALGKRDRVATDKDGVDPKDAVIGPIGAGRMDPELARFVSQCRDRILPNWNPLPAILSAHPDYKVVVSVSVSANGTLGSPSIIRSSGDSSFDRSAISAVVRTGRLPAPPPRYAASAAEGVMFTLSAADLR